MDRGRTLTKQQKVRSWRPDWRYGSNVQDAKLGLFTCQTFSSIRAAGLNVGPWQWMIKGQLEPNLSERLSGIHVDKYGTINQQGLSYRDTYLISFQNNRDLQILYPYLIRSQQPHQFSNHTRTFHSRSLAILVIVMATQNNTISSLDVLAASSKVMLMCFFL